MGWGRGSGVSLAAQKEIGLGVGRDLGGEKEWGTEGACWEREGRGRAGRWGLSQEESVICGLHSPGSF